MECSSEVLVFACAYKRGVAGVGGWGVPPPGQLSPRTADPKCGGSPPRVGGPPSFACLQGTITLSHTFPAVVEDNMEPLNNRRRVR